MGNLSAILRCLSLFVILCMTKSKTNTDVAIAIPVINPFILYIYTT